MTIKQSGPSLFSIRAINHLSHPQFIAGAKSQASFFWQLEYSEGAGHLQTDKILTLRYSHRTEDDIQNILLEALCRLVQGRTLSFVFLLNFREIESYLRDDNHVEAFGPEIYSRAQECFERLKSSLLVQILVQKLDDSRSSFGVKSIKSPWDQLSFVERNRAVSRLIAELNKLFGNEKALEFVLAEGDLITVKKNDFPLDLVVLEHLMGQIFSMGSVDSPLKVVGTL